MKPVIIIAVAFVLFIHIPILAQEMGYYANSKYAFSFEIPTDWRYQEEISTDGTNTYHTYYDTTWKTFPTNDLYMILQEVDAIELHTGQYYVAKSSIIIPASIGGGPGFAITETVLCDENDIATGGGFSYPDPTRINTFAFSYPHTENELPIGWTMVLDDWAPNDSVATVYAVCLNNP